MWGLHSSRDWGQGECFSFFRFSSEGELLLTKETERNFASCSIGAILTKRQATRWRQGHIVRGVCAQGRRGGQ